MGMGLMTADEVAARLKVPKTWVYRAAREGDLPSVRCGRYRRFDEGDVDRWISEHKGAAVQPVEAHSILNGAPPSPAHP